MTYSLIKLFHYSNLPKNIQDFFDINYRKRNNLITDFYLSSVKGKLKDMYSGKKIICKWSDDNNTYIIEKGDNIFFDWLLENGVSLLDDDLIIIKH